MENKAEVIGAITAAMKEAFDERQKQPFQYVVAYYLTKDDALLGYHADSFCNLTQEKMGAKRYNGKDPYGQLAIIRKNLDFTLLAQDVEGFQRLSFSVRERYFKGLSAEDVYIVAEYLEDGIPPQRFKFKIV